MKYSKLMLIMVFAIFICTVSATCAADANETTIATQEDNQMELTLTEDEIQTNENDNMLTQTEDAEILTSGEGSYSDLRNDINSGGNLTKSHYRYNAGDGDTIEINTPCVINGNGAVIDMAGSNIRTFYVSASGVTIKNLTIINANYNGAGGAIYFSGSGTVANCNFTNNKATGTYYYDGGGAVYFYGEGNVTNCNFTGNTATRHSGAVYFYGEGNVTNCNFTGNTATGDGGAVYFRDTGTVTNCNFTNNTATGDYACGGAVCFCDGGNVTNCNFTDNSASGNGGAVCFYDGGNVTNCNFVDNKATGDYSYGGAISIYSGNVTNCNFTNNSARYGGAVHFRDTGTVTNCNFTNNTATGDSGAVYFDETGTVTNCNFTNNSARYGGAVYFDETGTVTNCNFVENSASRGGAIFSVEWYTTADTCIFKRNSGDNVNTVIYPPTLNVNNFTTVYGSGDKLTFDLKTNSSIPVTNGNISISVYFKDNGVWVRNYTCLSSEGWIPDLPVGSYIAFFDTEYAEFQKINRTVTITMPNVRYSINVSSVTTNNKTVNITAKTDIPKDILWDGKLLFILPNGTQIEATYGANGTWWAEHTFDACGEYKINATYVGLDNVTINNGTITINKVNSTITLDDIVLDYGETKNVTVTTTGATGITAKIGESDVKVDGFVISIPALDAGTYTLTVTAIADNNHNNVTKNVTIIVNKLKTELTGSAITTTYNINKDLVITLKDSTGKALSGVKVTVNLNGAKTYTTDKNGHVKVSTKGIAPKAYTAKVTFNGDTNYDKSTKDIKVIVKKATPKLTAKKKTFKTTPKTKKYTIVLKDNAGKAIKKAKVTLKVKGKTYKATTNSKGKATFKITKLNKKGTFKATITYKGNKYYNKVSKKANIKVIVTFKTVSKGSKDKATVKEIQQALKDKGYYLTYQGHYLKVDGKFSSCTFRSVKEFQHDKGLKVTGKVDEKTAHKLGII